jgi:hypothetical protein
MLGCIREFRYRRLDFQISHNLAHQHHICQGAGTLRGQFASYQVAFRTGRSGCDGEICEFKYTCRFELDSANFLLSNHNDSPSKIGSAPVSKTAEKKSTVIIGEYRKLGSCVAKVCCVLLCCCLQCQTYRTVYPTQSAKYSLFPFRYTVGLHPRGEQTLRYRCQIKCSD